MANTWVFQGNPDHFDIDGFFATQPSTTLWLVTRYEREIAEGDRVFIWRNQGKAKAVPGVIAEARVVEAPRQRAEDPDSIPFWPPGAAEATNPRVRAALRIVRIANKKEVIKREWLDNDPILHDLPNIKLANGTNYRLNAQHTARLAHLWSRVGQDWTRDESLGGLYAYCHTLGRSISKLQGSDVAKVALVIGRPVVGVYNKVLNFRAIDPRDTRAGLSSVSVMDRAVWSEFYDGDTGQLDIEAVEKEYERLWSAPTPTVMEAVGLAMNREEFETVRLRLSDLSYEELLARYNKATKKRPAKPRSTPTVSRAFERDPLVVAIALKRADYKCEVPSCTSVPFETLEGRTYCEVHHIVPLAEGGEDTIENVACVCPSHHREVHFGKAAASLTNTLKLARTGGAP